MWSIEEYCASQTPWDVSSLRSSSARDLVQALQLPTVHPFCTTYASNYSDYYLPDIPRQGPLLSQDHIETWHDIVITILAQLVPSLLAMAELWWRLSAFFVAPMGILFLLHQQFLPTSAKTTTNYHALVCLATMTSAVVLFTDELYRLEFGAQYGTSTFLAATVLSWRTTTKHASSKGVVRWVILILWVWTFARMYYDTPSENQIQFEEGLYYDTTRSLATHIVQHWPQSHRTYTPATPWMPTGDARTGLPFLMNRAPVIEWHRLWLPLQQDNEVIALDIAFPSQGHDPNQPVYLILHGLNGGSQESYVREMAGRRLAEGSTVVVLVARGLMDLPVRGWNVFHGARWTDVQEAAQVLRNALGPNQILAGVGYSMGGIVLSNYVARSGNECALDTAVAISGGMDMRVEAQPNRAHRLWQPLVAVELRDTFVVGKWGERVRSRLSKPQMKALMRATNIAGIDQTAVVVYNGFRDLMHYYSEMSVLGDIPFEEFDSDAIAPNRRIHNVSIPFCVLHALDDPLITWKTIASNHGWKHPSNLTRTGSGNLFLLLTKRGGHVGWPLGWFPFLHNWAFMNDAAASFVNAVVATQQGGSTVANE